MKVSNQLALLIDSELHKQGYKRDVFILDSRFSSFAKEELEMITELFVEEDDDISGIEYLTNLKKLHIESRNYSDFVSGNSVYYNAHINQIKDFNFMVFTNISFYNFKVIFDTF